MTQPTTDEHLLPVARNQLQDAIHALAGTQRLHVDRDPEQVLDDLEREYQAKLTQVADSAARADLRRRYEEAVTAATATTTWTASRYQQLCEALESPRLERTGGHHDGPQPPVWVDAVDLRTKIGALVSEWAQTWQLACTEVVDRLHALADHGWRPQDVDAMQAIADMCVRWAAEIDSLFDPPRKVTLAAPCPSCQVATVYRPDETGEHVRQAALAITQRGCECLNCRYVWAPDKYVFLARLIGVENELSLGS